jgi:hypothetical protein
MNVRHIANLSSLVMGVLGSLYLSYDLFGNRGGILRRAVVGGSTALLQGGIYGGSYIVLAPVMHVIHSSVLPLFFALTGLSFVVGFLSGDTDLSNKPERLGIKYYFTQPRYYAIFGVSALLIAIVEMFLVRDVWLVVLFISGVVPVLCISLLSLYIIALASNWAFKTDQKRLGSIGALLTGIAFAMQFWLAL